MHLAPKRVSFAYKQVETQNLIGLNGFCMKNKGSSCACVGVKRKYISDDANTCNMYSVKVVLNCNGIQQIQLWLYLLAHI